MGTTRVQYREAFIRDNALFGKKSLENYVLKLQDAKFYSRAAKFPKSFSNKGKTTVIQFTVKHEQGIDCGGGYVKVREKTF